MTFEEFWIHIYRLPSYYYSPLAFFIVFHILMQVRYLNNAFHQNYTHKSS